MNIKKVTKKNGTIVYRASVYLGVDQLTGKKARTTVTSNTYKGCKAKARDVINEFANNGYTVKEKPSITTYEELAWLWWDTYKNTVKPNTRKAMKGALNRHILSVFGEYKLTKVTTPLIQQQVNKWADKVNKGEDGAYQEYGVLHNLNSRILQYGVTMQIIPSNPARDVQLPRRKQKEKEKIKYLDNQELKQFLTYLDTLDQSNYENLFNVVLYKTLLATGCRIGEMLALEWSDIDWDNATVSITKTLNRYQTINSPKSKKSIREIDIDRATILMLKQYKKRQQQQAWQLNRSEALVFSIFTETYPNSSVLRSKLKKHFEQAKVTCVDFHGFRHTHASIMMNAGLGYKELQHRLGHSTLAMTMDTYSHLSKENAKKAVSIFETAISNL